MSIIKNTREKSGFTQAELAKKTGLSLRTIQRLEASNKEPKGHSLKVLQSVLVFQFCSKIAFYHHPSKLPALLTHYPPPKNFFILDHCWPPPKKNIFSYFYISDFIRISQESRCFLFVGF